MTQITEWHRLAFLHKYRDLRLPEIVKALYIITLAEFIEDNAPLIGYNVLNNQELYQAIVLAMIAGYPQEQTINQREMAEAIGWSRPTVTRTITALEKNRRLNRVETASAYEILQWDDIPQWIKEFGKAIIELYYDDVMKEQLETDYKRLEIRRGLKVLFDELRGVKQRRTHDPNAYNKKESPDS